MQIKKKTQIKIENANKKQKTQIKKTQIKNKKTQIKNTKCK